MILPRLTEAKRSRVAKSQVYFPGRHQFQFFISQATHEDEGSRIVLYTSSDFSLMNYKEVVGKVAL